MSVPAPVWLYCHSNTAHAFRQGSDRSLCGRRPVSGRSAWPTDSKCGQCSRILRKYAPHQAKKEPNV